MSGGITRHDANKIKLSLKDEIDQLAYSSKMQLNLTYNDVIRTTCSDLCKINVFEEMTEDQIKRFQNCMAKYDLLTKTAVEGLQEYYQYSVFPKQLSRRKLI